MSEETPQPQIGLLGATGIGVGAIVGGGILVLAGVAFVHAGPGALMAFGINGVIALITVFSFAELASAFPESGGSYTFAKKVLSLRAAFATGWVLWFAYIVAAALYALGFAYYAALLCRSAWEGLLGGPPPWMQGRNFVLALGLLSTAAYAIGFARRSGGGKDWATIGKVVLFAVILSFGFVAVAEQPHQDRVDAIFPVLPQGLLGLLTATGMTFIALQGFEVIAAVAGSIKNPGKTVPRAMFLSLGIALVIYLPMLFIVVTVGVPEGSSITELSRAEPETVMATAVSQFMGVEGYWLVVVAAILSTLSALGANLLAASQVALSMARDRTLPAVLGVISAKRGTPLIAISITALITISLLLAVPDLAAAGATASLIFLLVFVLSHVTAILARARGGGRKGGFKIPLAPFLPAFGAFACAALALFQAVAVPSAGYIAFAWLALGGVFYIAIFAARAEVLDASAMAYDPDLARLRGEAPLVLLPIANPDNVASLVALGNAMAPPDVGRVLLHSIVVTPRDPKGALQGLHDSTKVVQRAISDSHATGHAIEALITTAPAPWEEIGRIALEHRCESLLLGIGDMSREAQIEELARSVDCDVAVLKAIPSWRLANARRILVPLGGRGGQHLLRARVLGSLLRTGVREVTFLRVVPEGASERQVDSAFREVERLASESVPDEHRIEIVQSDDAATAIVGEANGYDLMLLGLRGVGRRAEFGAFARRVARDSPCATLMLNARR